MANADDLRRLAEEMAVAYEERVNSILGIKGDTTDFLAETREEIKERQVYVENLLDDFDTAHQEMAKELKAKLASDEATRKTETLAEIEERQEAVSTMLGEFDEEDKERAAGIAKLLKEFDKAHAAMAAELKAKLASDEATRKTETEAEIKERRADVRSMLNEFRKEQEATAAAWKNLLAGMGSAREKVTISGPVEVEAAVEAETVEEAMEEAVEEEEVEYGELKDQILDLLDENPDGLRMVEIADSLDIPSWRSLIPVMRELLDEGEVTKEDSTYYIA